MLKLKFIPLILKQIVRARTRTLLTIGGVATAMFLFAAVQAMQTGVREATEMSAADTTLVVYRENRYCPATSRLPEYYGDRIAKVAGVESVTPIMIVVNNCRTSLDVVTLRGVPEEQFIQNWIPGFELLQGDANEWKSRTDAVLLGETLASRRGLKAGDQFEVVGVRLYVAGVIRSDQPQDQNVGYVHLPFLQQSTGLKKLGIVTQFNVKVTDPNQLERIADDIDREFANDAEPTQTSPEKAFVARAAKDVVEMVHFTKYLGYGCLAAVLALVANAIVLSVQDRVREHAVLQTLGFNGGLIARLIIGEGLLLGLAGGLVGTLAAMAATQVSQLSLSTEGLSIPITTTSAVLVSGLIVSTTLGILAGLVPAWQASRREITASFRAV